MSYPPPDTSSLPPDSHHHHHHHHQSFPSHMSSHGHSHHSSSNPGPGQEQPSWVGYLPPNVYGVWPTDQSGAGGWDGIHQTLRGGETVGRHQAGEGAAHGTMLADGSVMDAEEESGAGQGYAHHSGQYMGLQADIKAQLSQPYLVPGYDSPGLGGGDRYRQLIEAKMRPSRQFQIETEGPAGPLYPDVEGSSQSQSFSNSDPRISIETAHGSFSTPARVLNTRDRYDRLLEVKMLKTMAGDGCVMMQPPPSAQSKVPRGSYRPPSGEADASGGASRSEKSWYETYSAPAVSLETGYRFSQLLQLKLANQASTHVTPSENEAAHPPALVPSSHKIPPPQSRISPQPHTLTPSPVMATPKPHPLLKPAPLNWLPSAQSQPPSAPSFQPTQAAPAPSAPSSVNMQLQDWSQTHVQPDLVAPLPQDATWVRRSNVEGDRVQYEHVSLQDARGEQEERRHGSAELGLGGQRVAAEVLAPRENMARRSSLEHTTFFAPFNYFPAATDLIPAPEAGSSHTSQPSRANQPHPSSAASHGAKPHKQSALPPVLRIRVHHADVPDSDLSRSSSTPPPLIRRIPSQRPSPPVAAEGMPGPSTGSIPGSGAGTAKKFTLSAKMPSCGLKKRSKGKGKEKELVPFGTVEPEGGGHDDAQAGEQEPAGDGQPLGKRKKREKAEGEGGEKKHVDKVMIACQACREKKLRCTGERPCYNCVRRGVEMCDYVQELRRRGPGKNKKKKGPAEQEYVDVEQDVWPAQNEGEGEGSSGEDQYRAGERDVRHYSYSGMEPESDRLVVTKEKQEKRTRLGSKLGDMSYLLDRPQEYETGALTGAEYEEAGQDGEFAGSDGRMSGGSRFQWSRARD